ncbi:PREDICTED: uncharacterized protein LOC109233639 [Nicotiana attenuata]|uniref:uncharacterized protein LOC109233639 n=1 Tax=Nicotiana attenuata TaxID=49451 RepID=UPI00090506C7|nr:PREDICTED: uncharacterized protein LOC109233639 [Nicotiana attenuata]
MPFEQPAQDDATGVPNDELDPSMEDQGQESSSQVSIDPAPSPHFDAEPLNMVVPETNPDSEEDTNDLVYASFIRARTKTVATSEPPPKQPTSRLQQKEALEFALKKSKKSRRRRRLVKDGKVVQAEDVPVVDVDEETKEEPSSLTRKSSRKKHSLSQSEKHTSKGGESSSKSFVDGSSKKLVKSSGDKTVKERGDKSDEEEVEKSMKRKRDDDDDGDDEEPGSVKKGKVSETLRSEKRKPGNQKVPRGRTFSSDILESAGMRQLVDICDAQQWTNLFTTVAPIVYEDEVRSFYTSLFTVDGDQICVLVNGVDIVMDSALLRSILGVPTEGVSSAQGACTPTFRIAIVKDKAVHHGEQVYKKAVLPVYQLLFEMVNKVLLPRAKRRSVASKADLFLMETLDNFSSINLPAIMIEHMQKVENLKDGNPGLPYGFLLTKVFEFFKVPLGQAKVGTKKQSFSKTTLDECECIDKFRGVGSTSTIFQLINAQNSATKEIRKLKARNAILESQLSQFQEVPNFSGSHSAEVARLTKENAELRKQTVDENNEFAPACKSPILDDCEEAPLKRRRIRADGVPRIEGPSRDDPVLAVSEPAGEAN